MEFKIKNICCIGAGYVGGPTMAVISRHCPDIEVNVVDINEERIIKWNDKNLDNLPIYEPGLKEIIKECRGVNLHFSNDIKKHIENADLIFISVNTPTKTKGLGAGQASDLKWIDSSAREISKYSRGRTIVVEKSTLPVKTAQTIKEILEQSNVDNIKNRESKAEFFVLSNPEFLAEGTAINDLENPDRVLIGGEDKESIDALVKIYKNWIEEEKIITTNLWSSELSKLIANAFLAQRISSINSISALCECTGADISEVKLAIGTDKRIGNHFLNPGPGFGGSCFKKDISNLIYISNHYGLYKVSEYWQKVIDINEWQTKRISKQIVEKLFNTISSKKICILGFAFKANTNDTRESPAIKICKELLEENCKLAIYDPKVNPKQIENDLKIKQSKTLSKSNTGEWSFSESIINASKNSDAVVLLTEWEEFKNINWSQIYKNMRKPAWLFDTRSIVDINDVNISGLNFWKIGGGID